MDDSPSASAAKLSAQSEVEPSPETAQTKPTSILRCVTGAAIASAFSYGIYNLTISIATNFAAHPLTSDNYIAIRLSGMVRTLVIGIATMATALFGFAAFSLLILGIQTALQKLKPDTSTGT